MNGHRLIEKIGGGAFGEVWRAEADGRLVAVKILRRRPRSREVLAQVALGRLDGPDARHFPRVEAVDLESDPSWLRMELVEGPPLEDVLGGLSLVQRLDFGLKLLEALDAVHRHGFVHGDLSPKNVLVAAGGVKLIDVGFGKLFDDGADPVPSGTAEEADRFGVASPLYAAPERFRSEFLDGCAKSSDVFSFGKILYRLVTGESPHAVKPLSHKFPALGAAWDELLFRCLEEKPQDRFADAGAALAAYRAVYKPEPAEGEYRVACPQCRGSATIPGGWAGERFDCRMCGAQLEVLFYDETSREATVEVQIAFVGPEIEFLETQSPVAPAGTGAGGRSGKPQKKCPACAEPIVAEARKCKHCGVWLEPPPRAVAPPRSFVGSAWMTFLAYGLFWLPGAILNCLFLADARAAQRETGRAPEGLFALQLMAWLGVYLPLGALALMIVVGIFGAIIH